MFASYATEHCTPGRPEMTQCMNTAESAPVSIRAGESPTSSSILQAIFSCNKIKTTPCTRQQAWRAPYFSCAIRTELTLCLQSLLNDNIEVSASYTTFSSERSTLAAPGKKNLFGAATWLHQGSIRTHRVAYGLVCTPSCTAPRVEYQAI